MAEDANAETIRSNSTGTTDATMVCNGNDQMTTTYPMLFKSKNSVSNIHELHAAVEANAHSNFKIRLLRTFNIIFVGVFFLILLYLIPSALSELVGSCVITMYLIYFGIIFYFLHTGTQGNNTFHRIYSYSACPTNWANISITCHQLIYKNKAIQSISELSAIDGGVPGSMLLTLSTFSWAIVLMYIALFAGTYCDFVWDIADICQIIGMAGLLIIGMFELDPFNKWMIRFHYLGAVMGLGTIIGYSIQQYYIGTKLWLPVTIGSIGILAFCLWQIVCWRCEEFQRLHEDISESEVSQIRNEINSFTKRCIILEAIFLFSGALSTSLWIMEYNQNCAMGCRGPHNEIYCHDN